MHCNGRPRRVHMHTRQLKRDGFFKKFFINGSENAEHAANNKTLDRLNLSLCTSAVLVGNIWNARCPIK